MPDNDTLTYSYIAGLFDGEGCINMFSQRNKSYMRIDIINTNKECLELVQGCFGGKIHIRNRPIKTQYDLVLGGDTARNMLETILPYLIITRSRAELAIAFQGLVGLQSSAKPVPSVVIEARNILHSKLRELNK